ncbi:MAG: hypothetical protein K1Y36_24590 [Blastocatellia bacterium]|nr:hypothetical protein [Blastocatellia bacterium]
MRFASQKLILAVVIAGVLYLAGYLVFRVTHIEVWDKNQRAYVIFPTNQVFLYYFFRPMTYLDGAVTGMRFHIGPHAPGEIPQ